MRVSTLRPILLVALCTLVAPAVWGQNNSQDPLDQRSPAWWKARYETILKSRIFANLVASPSLYGTDIRVSVDGHTATLSGDVSSQAEQERALGIARRTSGVFEVRDQLTIDREGVEQRRVNSVPDEQLAQQVAEKLAKETLPAATADKEWIFGWKVEGPNYQFDVDADDGQITLDGSVNSWEDIGAVIRAARMVPGVRSIDSDLEVEEENSRLSKQYYDWYPFVQ